MTKPRVAIIGGGFSGLTIAYTLQKYGIASVVYEAQDEVGGLASSFTMHGTTLDKFYHHWFTSDAEVLQLVSELGMSAKLSTQATRTGMYYAHNFYKLSSPIDLLRYKPLAILDRIRLGLLYLKASKVQDWGRLESIRAKDWLIAMGGINVYQKVWEPLLKGKFGSYADEISAVWIWNKLKLRGGSRGKKGQEQLMYLEGGFATVAMQIEKQLTLQGSKVLCGQEILSLTPKDTGWQLTTKESSNFYDVVIATCALPEFSNIINKFASESYLASLNAIPYLANVCLILELNQPLSDLYWINVADPSFPFVGIIEHTNFINKGAYNNRHLVYLSRYLEHTNEIYNYDNKALLSFALPHIRSMFPKFDQSTILQSYSWKARYAQPIVTKHYSSLIPSTKTPYKNLYLCSMAQIYPEDRGTNYAIREGRQLAEQLKAQGVFSF
ncbi:MAG: NAD(P)/FAD-dependent oxidoreductase [Methylacidiphilales bacterium]|nr:NAD(P)/FAD-dependent oxidoreductase [Candidatus Methylacidiphilales bacterium]